MIAYILSGSLIIIAIYSFYITNYDVSSPIVAFTIPFAVASVNLLFNIKRWDVNLKVNTYLLIIVGVLSFLIGCLLANSVFKSRKKHIRLSNLRVDYMSEDYEPIRIDSFLIIAFSVFQVISLLYCLMKIGEVARVNGYAGNIFSLIGGYKRLSTFTTINVSLGSIGDILYLYNGTIGYIWIYVLIYNYISCHYIDLKVLVNLILSILLLLSKGGRNSTIQLLCAGLSMFVIIMGKKRGARKLSRKQWRVLIIVLVVVIFSFQSIGNFMGRNSTTDLNHYIAIYLSAPIRNFDEFVNKKYVSPNILGKMTFVRLINQLGSHFNISNWIYELDLPFLYPNGEAAGNVYTTFYAFYYDFKGIGIVLMSFIMGFISQRIFCKAVTKKQFKNRISLSIIVYSMIYFMLALSFFSNKFYEGIITIAFFERVIFLWITIKIIERIRFKLK